MRMIFGLCRAGALAITMLSVAVLAAASAQAARFTITTLDVPFHDMTQVANLPDVINDRDQVVGYASNASGSTDGFVWQDGRYTVYRQASVLIGINNHGLAAGSPQTGTGYVTIDTDAGTTRFYTDGFPGGLQAIGQSGAVLASHTGPEQVTHGFELRGDVRTLIMVPHSDVPRGGTYPTAINSGDTAVGSYFATGPNQNGFVLADGKYTTFNAPNTNRTSPVFITDRGEIGGGLTYKGNDATLGFVLRRGVYYGYLPEGAFSSVVVGIGPGGEVVGSYLELQHLRHHGLIAHGHVLTAFDVPGAQGTSIIGVNARGSLVGNYTDGQGVQHVYVAQCPAGQTCTQ